MFKAEKRLKIEGTKKSKLQVNTKEGKTVSTSRKIEEVTMYFKQCFYKDSQDSTQIEEGQKPRKLDNQFNFLELQKAIKKLMNDKAAGCDNIIAEQLKNISPIVACEIAIIFVAQGEGLTKTLEKKTDDFK